MKLFTSRALAIASITSASVPFSAFAFTVSSNGPLSIHTLPTRSSLRAASEISPFFMEEVPPPNAMSYTVTATKPTQTKAQEITTKAKPKSKGKKSPAGHKEGVFSPVVLVAKTVMGDKPLNQLRAKFITFHSQIIKDFVSTSDTSIGSTVSELIFQSMDKNKDGEIDEEELKLAFQAIGFDWLKDKQVKGILKRADKDENGILDYEEFKMEIPRTLKTNLVKLAKKNGGEMGLLV